MEEIIIEITPVVNVIEVEVASMGERGLQGPAGDGGEGGGGGTGPQGLPGADFDATKAPVALTDGATITWDYSLGYNSNVTLAGNRTLAITNVGAGDYGLIRVTQDATGSRTLTLPAGSKVIGGGVGAVTLTTTAAAIDILTFYYNGTNFYWNIGKNYN